MRTILGTLALVAAVTSGACAQDAITPKVLGEIKKATVFVKVELKQGSGSGSGFVVKKDGDGGLIATNLHVVYPKELDLRSNVNDGGKGKVRPETRPMSRAMLEKLKDIRVTMVFDSGTPAERSTKAEILAIDPFNDLAVLKVTGVKDFPEPISFDKSPEVYETAPVYTFGFPFGKALATSKGGPAITIGKAAVSSLRMDDDGELMIVQIDGALNPGNSGGPVVNGRGQLVGVAVATIRDSSGIGLPIPAERIKTAFLGRIGDVQLSPGKDKSVNVEVGLIDPLGTIKSASLYYVSASAAAGLTKKPASIETLAGCKKVALTLDKRLATGTFEFDAKQDFLLQVGFETAGDKMRMSSIATREFKKVEVAKAPDPGPIRRPVRPADGKTVYSAGLDASIRQWDLATGKVVMNLDNVDPILTFSVSPSRRFVVAVSKVRMQVWQLEDRAHHGDAPGVMPGVFWGGENTLFWTFDNGAYEFHDVSKKAMAGGKAFPVKGAALAGRYNKTIFVTLGDDVRYFRSTFKAEIEATRKKLPVPDATCAAFAPNGAWVLIGSSDRRIRQIDTATEQVIATYDAVAGVPRSLAVSGDGRRFISGGDDKVLHLWNVGVSKEIAHSAAQSGTIQAVAFTPANNQAVSAGTDAAVVLWNLPTSKK